MYSPESSVGATDTAGESSVISKSRKECESEWLFEDDETVEDPDALLLQLFASRPSHEELSA